MEQLTVEGRGWSNSRVISEFNLSVDLLFGHFYADMSVLTILRKFMAPGELYMLHTRTEVLGAA